MGDVATATEPFPNMPWAQSHGMYLAGRAALDEADALAAAMETKWGCGRLRLLVSAELREKFDRQRLKLNHALWHGTLDDVKREAPRMCAAWRALDRAATEAGAGPLDPRVIECTLTDGSVAVIVPDNDAAHLVRANDRRCVVYTAEEIARLLDGYPDLAKIKDAFPGSTVERVKRSIDDPLDSLPTGELANDEIPF
jgi:hypothetical protein